MKVFLGGTCNKSTWRNKLKPSLGIDFFDPVVDDWDEECQQREITERSNADILLTVLTPKMSGTYAVAEAVEDAITNTHKALLVIIRCDEEDTFDDGQWRSIISVCKMCERHGAHCIGAMNPDIMADYVAKLLNRKDIHTLLEDAGRLPAAPGVTRIT